MRKPGRGVIWTQRSTVNWDEDPVNEDDERTPEQRDAAPISHFPISESGKLAPAPETSVVPVPGPFQKTTMLSRHISYLKDFFRSYKDFTTAQLDTIELMLQKLYRRFDMDDYTDFSQVAPEKFPTMSDFYDLLEEEYDLYDAKKKNLFSEETIQEVCLGLHSMCKGAESKYFNGHTNIKDDKFLGVWGQGHHGAEPQPAGRAPFLHPVLHDQRAAGRWQLCGSAG